MKHVPYLLFLQLLLIGCSDQKLTPGETVIRYYAARDALNFNETEKLLSDSITITEGDYVMSYNTDNFYEVFKWDSLFQPSYKIVELEENKNHIVVTVFLNSIRLNFLNHGPMTCQYKITFRDEKIAKFESLDCTDVDWNTWQKNRDHLVRWTHDNHPELGGFIHDMTANGARNYLHAIEHYNAKMSDN